MDRDIEENFNKNFGDRTSSSYGGGAGNHKKSLYRRVSVHYFHVMKDQMACCCCVPLGMAFHIIACLDILVGAFLAVQVLENYTAAREDRRALAIEVIANFYNWIAYILAAILVLYTIPRIPMYLMTLCRRKSYGRLKYYFRTRVMTFVAMVTLLAVFMFMLYKNSEDLAVVYYSNATYIMFQAAGIVGFWAGIDLYWSFAIRTYKDSKKGKQGRNVAERM